MTRAALYIRVSTDDQAREGRTLPDQERRCREVAEREGWEATLYSDPARSGADRDRPGLARCEVEAGALDLVWFDTQDRLAWDVGLTSRAGGRVHRGGREHIAAQLDARISEAGGQAAPTTREATDLRTQSDRVERDYRRGALAAEDYARLRADIAEGLLAAEA